MKAKYLNLPKNLPTTHRDLQEAENKKIASIIERKKEQVDQSPTSQNDQPDLNPIMPISDQTILDRGRPQPPADARSADARTPATDARENIDARKNADARKTDEYSWQSRIDKDRISLRLPKEKLSQYKVWCFINKISLQDAFEQAMDMFMDARDNADVRASGRPLDHDLDLISEDLIDDKSSSIMEFYAKWTGNKIKDGDRENYKDIAHLDTKVIQIGILLTIARAKNKIGSFKYCLGAIEETSKQKIETPDTYIKYLTDKINKNKTIRPK